MKELFLLIIIISVIFLGLFLFCGKTTEDVGICHKIENFKETIKNKKDQFIEERKENFKNEWEKEKEEVSEEVKEAGKNIIEKGIEKSGSFIKNFLEEKKVELMECLTFQGRCIRLRIMYVYRSIIHSYYTSVNITDIMQSFNKHRIISVC